MAQEKAAEEAMRKTAVELEEDELSDAPLGSSGPPVKPGLFRGATTVSASRPAQLQIGGGASGHLPRRASSTGASDYSLHPLSPGSQSGEIGGLQRKHSISSSRSSPKPRLGSFGFGAPLGPASPSAGRGGKRVEMLSSIVSKAFDDDLDFGGSSGDESSGVELGRVVSAVMPTSSAARGGNAEFRGPRLSQSLDTTDEFDF